MRIYADFNAQIDPGGPDRPGLVHLDRMGTLRDLCAGGVRLREGLQLTLYTDSDVNEDPEIEATARWIRDAESRDGGYWAGEFDPKNFREVPTTRAESVSSWFPCLACRRNLAAEIARTGLSSRTQCPDCSTRVHEPIAPPREGV